MVILPDSTTLALPCHGSCICCMAQGVSSKATNEHHPARALLSHQTLHAMSCKLQLLLWSAIMHSCFGQHYSFINRS